MTKISKFITKISNFIAKKVITKISIFITTLNIIPNDVQVIQNFEYTLGDYSLLVV